MPVRITGRHLEVTPDIREYLERKLPRIEKYSDRSQSMEFVLTKDRYQHKVDLHLKDGPISVKAGTQDPVLLRAIDSLIDKVERLLKSKWAKLRGDTKRKGPPRRSATPIAELAEIVASAKPGKKKSKSAAKPSKRREAPEEVGKLGVLVFHPEPTETEKMSVEEAAEALFFRDENFLCFSEKPSGRLLVIYRRKDGNFGLIEPR
ncbi:MAG: ribosome-associated translation inhibitor RaiA [Candidatus Sumerlaeaceae bacterium]|nr:ribosome-associated translation inhibitor RaiA [Candidatus Sumerlaeaceae bacterium]